MDNQLFPDSRNRHFDNVSEAIIKHERPAKSWSGIRTICLEATPRRRDPENQEPSAPAYLLVVSEPMKAAPSRTPEPSEILFSFGELAITEVDHLRQLMEESLTSFAVEMGT